MVFGLLFVASGAVVVIAGTFLARFGDAIAVRTRLGGLWIGAVLLAGATSLPELGTDIAAVRMGALDLAVGDLFGSSMANMLILALVDLLPPRRQVLRRATLAATPVFAYAAKELAVVTGLGTTFVGTWLVGLSTSLPELIAYIAAVRIGAFDLAVGNLFGSNAFNVSILLWLDVASPGTSLFSEASKAHALSGLFAVVLMALGLAAIVYRAEKRFAMIEPDSALIVLAYALAIWVLFLNRGMA